jgi:ABC-type branched-subunit amino acid transport system substrate-binding protein
MKRSTAIGISLAAAAVIALPALPASAAVKPGQACAKLDSVKDGLKCVKKGTKRVYAAATAPTTVAPKPVAGATPAAATPAAAPAGLQNVPGFDGKTITIGYLGNVSVNSQFPASASFATGGKALTAGFNAYIDRINAAGGIAGKYPVKVLFKETYYTPSEVAKGYAEVKNQVVMIGQIYGTPGTQTLAKSLADDGLVASPISLDAAWVNNANILPIGSTYQKQAINVIDYAVKEQGAGNKTWCSLALANNAYGDAGEEGFKLATKGLNLKVGVLIKTSTAPAQAQALKDAKCDWVHATISGEAQMSPLLAETAKLDYFPFITGNSPSAASGSVTPANSAQYAKQVFIAADGVQWGDESIPGMKKHIADLSKNAPEQIGTPNPATEWGYANAIGVVALLNKAVANGDLSKPGMLKALATLGPVNFEGIYPAWNFIEPAKRVASSQTNIYSIDISTPGALKLIKPYESALAKSL